MLYTTSTPFLKALLHSGRTRAAMVLLGVRKFGVGNGGISKCAALAQKILSAKNLFGAMTLLLNLQRWVCYVITDTLLQSSIFSRQVLQQFVKLGRYISGKLFIPVIFYGWGILALLSIGANFL